MGDIFDQTILKTVKAYGCNTVLAVRGNHDSPGPFPEGINNLHMKQIVINEITFGGFSGCWRYKPRGSYLFDQWEVNKMMEDYPPVDVFIAHNSPREIHERDDDVHQGFDGFRDYINRAEPQYFFHGHQHINQITKIGRTKIVGVFGEIALKLELYR